MIRAIVIDSLTISLDKACVDDIMIVYADLAGIPSDRFSFIAGLCYEERYGMRLLDVTTCTLVRWTSLLYEDYNVMSGIACTFMRDYDNRKDKV